MPAFMSRLRKEDSLASQALQLIALTAVRSNEALASVWSEFDLANRIWTVPASRMKMGKEHVVPLPDAAVKLLKSLPRDNERLFPGLDRRVVWGLVKRLGGGSIHGFRSTFRDWAGERTSFPREIAELSLAHSVGTKVEQAYSRTTLLAKRRALMDLWGGFCAKPSGAGAVIPIRGAS
jgi:integrase